MPSKTTKKARRAGSSKQVVPESRIKDDGHLYVIVDTNGRKVYDGKGVPLGEAERLSEGLIAETRLERVE